MTREEAKRRLLNIERSLPNTFRTKEDVRNFEALEMAIEALEQEPSGDLISRQAVIDVIKSMSNANPSYWNKCDVVDREDLIDEISELPSVKQEPKTGRWEWVQYDYNPKLGNWHCSECRCVVVECVDKNEKGGIPWYKYCPQCGAKMVEPQESEDKCKNCEYYHNPDYTRCHKCKAESEDKE